MLLLSIIEEHSLKALKIIFFYMQYGLSNCPNCTLREKCPNTDFFLVRIQENTGQKNSVFGHFSRSDKYVLGLGLGPSCL